VVVLVLAILACVRWPMPTGVAEHWRAQRLQRTVSIEGAASVCLCTGPTLRVASIEIGPPEWSQATRFLLSTDSEIRFAGTVIASMLLGAVVTPLAALLPMLDFGEGDVPSPCRERFEARPSTPAAKPTAARPPRTGRP
jgi:hypothetical protein